MKKHLLLVSLSLAAFAGALTSCSSDPEYDATDTIKVSEGNFAYKDGVWTRNEVNGNIEIDDYIFTHTVDNTYGFPVIYGFTPSQITDTSKHDPLSSFPYASASGGGANGKNSPYLVGAWAEYMDNNVTDPYEHLCAIYPDDGDTFKPVSIDICNTTWVMYAVLDGTPFSKKFGIGDTLSLTAHGVHVDGSEATETTDLINVEGSDVLDGILTSWKTWNLENLGACKLIYFTMDSSDRDPNLGINTPTYFCIDNLVVED